ncbi:MAG: hypothetical protein KUG64_07730 [Cycloclasticus sp.]|nr:hypothetical protein [Cycloclasticus sp.]
MASGKEQGKENLSLFNNWLSERDLRDDWQNYIRRNKLNRTEICRECGFSNNVFKKAPLGNKEICDRLFNAESMLKKKGLIKEAKVADLVLADKARESKVYTMEAKVSQLEQENALLKSEIQRKNNEQKTYKLFMSHMQETGIMPR